MNKRQRKKNDKKICDMYANAVMVYVTGESMITFPFSQAAGRISMMPTSGGVITKEMVLDNIERIRSKRFWIKELEKHANT